MPSAARLLIVTLLALLTRAADARDIYVNNRGGDDGATGHHAEFTADRSGPVRTIAKALRLAENGDRILLANTGRPYRESISFVGSRQGGTSLQRFVLQGNGAILDGSAPVPEGAWEHYRAGVFRFNPLKTECQQLFLKDRPLARVIANRFADAPPKLEPLEWTLHNGYIYFRVQHDRMPVDYDLSYAEKETGITLYHVQYVTIADLTVQGFQIDGINAFNSARFIHLVNVTCRGNGRSGITVGGASLVEVDRSLAGNNGVAQLLTEPLSVTRVVQSQLLSNTAPAWVDHGGKVSIDGQPVQGGLDDRKPDVPKSAARSGLQRTASRPPPLPNSSR